MPQSEYWKIVLGDFNVSLLCIVMSPRSNTDASDLVYVMLFFCFFLPPDSWDCFDLYVLLSVIFMSLSGIRHCVPPACCVSSLLTLAPFHLWKKCMLCQLKNSKLLTLSVKVTAAGCLSRCVTPAMDCCHASRMSATPPSPQDRWDGPQHPATLGAG